MFGLLVDVWEYHRNPFFFGHFRENSLVKYNVKYNMISSSMIYTILILRQLVEQYSIAAKTGIWKTNF